MPRVNSLDPRRKARMVSLQCLFGMDLRNWSHDVSLEWLSDEDSLSQDAQDLAGELIEGVRENLSELDELIHRYAPAWPVGQLSLVDRNVLRIALFELLCRRGTPKKSAVNEAVELAKAFGSESSARFVNGVLGSIILDLDSGALAADQLVREGR